MGAGVDRAGRIHGGVLYGPAGGVVAADRARTPSGAGHRPDHRVDRGDRAGLQLGARGVGAHRAAAGGGGRTPRQAAEQQKKGLLDSLDDNRRHRQTGRRSPSPSCQAPRLPRRPTDATVRRWLAPPRRPWSARPPRPSPPAARIALREPGIGLPWPALPDRRLRTERRAPSSPRRAAAAPARRPVRAAPCRSRPICRRSRAAPPAPPPDQRCRPFRPRRAAPPWLRRLPGTRRRARRWWRCGLRRRCPARP